MTIPVDMVANLSAEDFPAALRELNIDVAEWEKMSLCFEHASFCRDNLAADELAGVTSETASWISESNEVHPFE